MTGKSIIRKRSIKALAGIVRLALPLLWLALPISALAQVTNYSQNVWISEVTSSVDEGEHISFVVNREGRTDFPLDVTVNIAPDSPIEGFHILDGGDDTDGINVTVTIANGSTSATGGIYTINNAVVNAAVALTLEIKDTNGVITPDSRTRPASARSTVNNGVDRYVLGVRLASAPHTMRTVTEGDSVELMFMRCVGHTTGDSIQTCSDAVNDSPQPGAISPPALTQGIFVEVTGNYFAAGDVFETVTLAAGEFSKTYTLTPVDDDIDEADGLLVVQTVAGTDYENRNVAITITDDDLPIIRLDTLVATVNEGAAVFFTVVRIGERLPATRIEVGVGFHAKIFNSEAALPATTRYLDFAEGRFSATLLAGVTHNDELNEGDGMIRADLQVSSSEYNIINRGEGWTRVIDDDVPVVSLSVAKNSLVEGDEIAWSVTRDCCADNNLPLANALKLVLFYPNEYFPDNVFEDTRLEPTQLRFAAVVNAGKLTSVFSAPAIEVGPLGGYEQRRILEFPADNFEGIPRSTDQTFKPRYTVTSTDWVRVDIQNSTPGVVIESAQDSVTEGDTMDFVVTRYGGHPEFLNQHGHRVRIDVAQTGNYLAASELGERIVTFSRGQTSVQLGIATNGDGFDLADGTVTLTVLEGADTDLSEDSYVFDTRFSDLQGRYTYKASVDILDDDQFGVTVSREELTISEGDEGTYTVVLDAGPAASVTVTPSRSSGDADVTASGALTFTASDWNVAQTVTVSAAVDNDTDNDTAVIGHSVSGGDYDSFAADSVRITVNDVGAISNGVTLSVSPTEVAESAAATSITVSAALTGGARARRHTHDALTHDALELPRNSVSAKLFASGFR